MNTTEIPDLVIFLGRFHPLVVHLPIGMLMLAVTLPEHHKEYMPTEGKTPLTDEEVEIIKWWITDGAKAEATLATLTMDDHTKGLISNWLGLEASASETKITIAASHESIEQLTKAGFVVKKVSQNNEALDLRLTLGIKRPKPDFKALLAIKEQLVSLSVPKSEVTDQDLEVIGQLQQLRTLNLSHNPISDQGMEYLSGLKHLQVLNINNTEIDENSEDLLAHFERLERVYQ